MLEAESLSLTIFLNLYNGLWRMLLLILLPILRLVPRLRPQLEGRELSPGFLQTLTKSRQSYAKSAVFFCSSAGEYEQAKPLMKRLQAQGDVFVFLILVSHSGRRFALAQEESVPLTMAPWDCPSNWRRLFAALKPDFFVVVRYELWPGFLYTARSWAPIYLIDAVQSPSLVRPGLPRLIRRTLVRACRKVFVVGAEDQVFYADLLAQNPKEIAVFGDTKYDRVLERIEERRPKKLELQNKLANFLSSGPVFILGSAWPRDLEILLEVYPELQRLHPHLKLIIAPHDVSADMISRMEQSLRAQNLTVCRAQQAGLAAARADDKVLLVDMIGLLPELYALADIAWVGGALHHRVHNVLEPACQGLFVCFGPRYHTSQEARQLVGQGLVKVIESGQDFLEWVRSLSWQGRPPHLRLYEAITQHQGASDRILRAINLDLLTLRR